MVRDLQGTKIRKSWTFNQIIAIFPKGGLSLYPMLLGCFVLFLVVLRFELRALLLLGNCESHLQPFLL
jgi:hypothetical protein